MSSFDPVSFPPFHLDRSRQLWCGEEERFLRPKTLAVLHYLVARAGQVVSKDELLAAVWPEVMVSEAVLTVCINELRQALEDNPRQPRFIATVHRRGYRFIAPLRATPPVSSVKCQMPSASPLQVSSLQSPASIVVGREAELAQLQQWWDLARSGQRQVVFIAGEPGIGKTTLVDRFLARISHEHAHEHEVWIGRGQCIEQYGEGEAYLPVLEALGQLCRGPEGRQVQEVLHRYAPTWLLQMPGLVETAELSALQVRTAGATRERMLREMAEALEALTVARGLVLVCEDVHVSDRSTLDLIAYLARRRGPAHLLILGTYRLAEVIVRAHALQAIVQELRGHQQCHSLALELLSERAVGEYLTVRFAPQPVPAAFSAQLYERTEGNALFVVTLVDYLLQRGLLRQEQGEWQWPGALHGMGVPESVRQLIERQVEHLAEEEQRVLEVASVGGVEFSAAAVSAGLEIELLRGEERCEAIARRTLLLQPRGMEEWPDGTGASRYRFRHAVHQEVVYARIPEVRRARLHKAIGERIEEGYGERAGEVAAELALHFTSGRDFHRAVSHLQTAADNALRRHAFAEAIGLLRRALELLQAWPDTPARAQQELALQVALGTPLLLTKGQASPEVERTYNRARELCRQVGDTPQLFLVLLGLWRFYSNRAQYQIANELAGQFLGRAQSGQDRVRLAHAHAMQAQTLFLLGEFTQAKDHAEQGLACYDPSQHRSQLTHYGIDARIFCLSYMSHALWMLGYPDQALQRSQEALAWGQELSHAFNLALAFERAATCHFLRREEQAVHEWVEAGMALSHKHGFAPREAYGRMLQGWVLVQHDQCEEGIVHIREGITSFLATGAELFRTYFLALLAEAYGKGGQPIDGLRVVAEALTFVDKTEERVYEAELWRFKGELLLQQAKTKIHY